MTSLTIDFNGRRYILTDESPQSTYGNPVLVADDNRTFGPDEYVDLSGSGPFGFGEYPGATAYDAVSNGRRQEISREDWPSISAMLHRFADNRRSK